MKFAKLPPWPLGPKLDKRATLYKYEQEITKYMVMPFADSKLHVMEASAHLEDNNTRERDVDFANENPHVDI